MSDSQKMRSEPLDRRRARTAKSAIVGILAGIGGLIGILVVGELSGYRPIVGTSVTRWEPFVYVAVLTGGLTFALVEGFKIEIERLRELAMTDPLTGLLNRRPFEDRLKREIVRATRHHQALTLLLIDVDHLKRINDVGGHAAGDRAIRRIADALMGSLRRSDLVARIGGDEFAVLLPSTYANDATAMAQRIHEWLRRESPEDDSVSIGVADLGTRVTDERSLFLAADAALYAAKTAGGGQTVLAARWPTAV